MNKVLVTGAAGFLGSHISEEMLNLGKIVIGADNFFRGKKEYLPDNEAFIFEEIDLLIYDDVRELISKYKPECIIHYAAINGTEYFYEKPWQVLENNITMTMNLIKAIEEAGYFPKKLVYASSSEVYGEKPRKIPTAENELINLDISAIRDSYASSKAIGEFIVKNFCITNNLDYLIFRIFNAYGPRMDTSKYGQVVPEFIHKAMNDSKFSIIGNGMHTRSFCFVKDHARMAVEIIQNTSNRVLNLGSESETKIIDLASEICRILAVNFDPIFLEPRLNDPLRRSPDIQQLANYAALPKYTLEEGLRETIKWYQE